MFKQSKTQVMPNIQKRQSTAVLLRGIMAFGSADDAISKPFNQPETKKTRSMPIKSHDNIAMAKHLARKTNDI